jgi:hypothetical protein
MEVVAAVGDFDIRSKSNGVVNELCIGVDPLVKNGLENDKLGADDGDFGDVERLRVCFFEDFSRTLLRDCLEKEDIKRLAAAIGPIDKLSLIKLDFRTVEFVNSSLEGNASLLAILNKIHSIFIYITDENVN